MLPFVRWLFAHAVAAIAEPRCAGCDGPVPLETVFCGACAASLQKVSGATVALPPAEAKVPLVSPFVYGGAIKDAIVRFKYGERDDLARPIGALLLRGRRAILAHAPEVVIPVPAHPVRLAERGFDPAALLARELARGLEIPLVVDGLEKVRPTLAQASLDKASRRVNLDGAFAVPASRAPRLRGARVVLVDDVRTTGATLGACRAALTRAGAEVVVEAVVAFAEATAGS
jgi:ComF family protein